MRPLHTLAGLVLGLTITVAATFEFDGAWRPALQAARAVMAQALRADPMARLLDASAVAEVAVRFDADGRVAGHSVTRSSGSRASDETAISAALELAELQQPSQVAGGVRVYRICYGA